jgi:hypothetical protein
MLALKLYANGFLLVLRVGSKMMAGSGFLQI